MKPTSFLASATGLLGTTRSITLGAMMGSGTSTNLQAEIEALIARQIRPLQRYTVETLR